MPRSNGGALRPERVNIDEADMHAAVGMIDTPEDLADDVAGPAVAFPGGLRFALRVAVGQVALRPVGSALGRDGHLPCELLADGGENLRWLHG